MWPFNKPTRRPPPPPERPMQAVIPPVPPTPTPEKSIYVIPPIEGAIYNICLTTLLTTEDGPRLDLGHPGGRPLDQGRGFAGLRPLP